MKRVTGFLSGAGALLFPVSGFCALDLSSITIDYSPVETLAGIIVAAIAAIWAIKKVIKLANRS